MPAPSMSCATWISIDVPYLFTQLVTREESNQVLDDTVCGNNLIQAQKGLQLVPVVLL